MSRVGKKAVVVPKDVKVQFDGLKLSVKGPKGELNRTIHPSVKLDINDANISLSISDKSKESESLYGLFRSLISNMVEGVSNGFKKTLEIIGVGYRVELSGRQLVFNLGYSNPVTFDIPKGIEAQVEKKNILTLFGIDKELLGDTAATIRSLRPPEPYKGKGIKYLEEKIRRKAGKAGAKT
ncbi:MAG: 50S ribosomal protein L6 [Thermodesulfobacteriota bacterium]|nr:50S ribosomal protein L6 [Thermodesulfobacteriota bacterium]